MIPAWVEPVTAHDDDRVEEEPGIALLLATSSAQQQRARRAGRRSRPRDRVRLAAALLDVGGACPAGRIPMSTLRGRADVRAHDRESRCPDLS